MMGAGAISHLHNFVAYYSRYPAGRPDRNVGERAAELARNPSKPEIIRDFYRQVHLARTVSHKKTMLYQQLLQNVYAVDVLNQYNNLCQLTKDRNPVLKQYLDENTQGTRVGRSCANYLRKYLRESLRLTEDAFDSLINVDRSPYALVANFGPGILCLLLKGAVTL